MKDFCAVILAAGKGTRIKARKINKVMSPLAGKPMISYTVDLLKKSGFKKIIVVVGFLKKLIMDYFGDRFIYAEQKKRLGTAHALRAALLKIPSGTKNVFSCYSDDTAFYPPSVIKRLVKIHLIRKQDLTVLTVIKDNPFGLGRIIRDRQGKIRGIVEEKNATPTQKKIKEINTGCYCFNLEFLREYLPLIKKDPIKKEYYLTDIVSLAIKGGKKVNTVKVMQGEYFHGVNTKEQLLEAQKKMERILKKRN